MKTLKSCPYCGGTAYLQSFYRGPTIGLVMFCQCLTCYARGPESLENEQAIELWNKRWEAK